MTFYIFFLLAFLILMFFFFFFFSPTAIFILFSFLLKIILNLSLLGYILFIKLWNQILNEDAVKYIAGQLEVRVRLVQKHVDGLQGILRTEKTHMTETKYWPFKQPLTLLVLNRIALIDFP